MPADRPWFTILVGTLLALAACLIWEALRSALEKHRPRIALAVSRMAFAVPGLVAGIFAFLWSRQPLLDRCFSSVAAGLAVQFGTLLGALVCIYLAAKLKPQSGQGAKASRFLDDEANLLAPMLLATAIWMWWQVDRENTVRELASCVDQVAVDDSLNALRPGQAVLQCWRDRATRDIEPDE